MTTATATPKAAPRAKRDRLSDDEMADVRDRYYEAGQPYLWTLTQGWALVGFYVRHDSGLFIVVAHANHFRNAGKDYGRLATEGADASCEWRYEGLDLVNVAQVLKVSEYHGAVNRGRVRVGG